MLADRDRVGRRVQSLAGEGRRRGRLGRDASSPSASAARPVSRWRRARGHRLRRRLRTARELLGRQLVDGAAREAGGLTTLYAKQAIKSSDEGGFAPAFVGAELEKATGDRIYYAGLPLFPGQTAGLRRLPAGLIDWRKIRVGESR